MFDNIEDAFKQLDEAQYWPFAEALANYRDALIKKDFTRDEAMKIVNRYAKFIYQWALTEAMNEGFNIDKFLDEEDDTDTP